MRDAVIYKRLWRSANKDRVNASRRAWRTRRGTLRNCAVCGRPFLSQVWRHGRPSAKYCSRRCVGLSSRGRYKAGTEATELPTRDDYLWAAGIFEGEGNCGSNRRCAYARVVQRDPWLTERFRALFGGTVTFRKGNHRALAGYRVWSLHGLRAQRFLRRIYFRLSPRRQLQVDKALEEADKWVGHLNKHSAISWDVSTDSSVQSAI